MKTPVVIGVVVALHCVALGTLLMTQGCGTSKGSGGPVQFQDKPAVLPKPATKDVMPEKMAKPHAKPVIKEDDEDIFSQPLPPMKKDAKAAKEIKPAAGATKSYTIKSGDSLGSIANRFKITMNEVKELNPSIKDIAKIREGQVIKLPSYVNLNAPAPKKHSKPKAVKTVEKDAVAGAVGGAFVAPAVSGAAAGEYVIVSGDYPEKIAKKLGVKQDDLMKANKITDPKKLKIGQKLVVPGAAPSAQPAFPMAPVEQAPIAPMAGFDSTSAVPGVAPVAPAMGPAPLAPAAPGQAPALKPLAPAAPGAAMAPAKPVVQKHLVAPGETLKDIAMLYTVTVADIMRANGMASEAVAPGQSLNIPTAQ